MTKSTPDVIYPVFGTYYDVFSETSKKKCQSTPPHAVVFNRLVNSQVATIFLDNFQLKNIYYDITENEIRKIQIVTLNHKQELLKAYEKIKAGK